MKPKNIARNEEEWYVAMAEKAVQSKTPYEEETKCLGEGLGNHERDARRHNMGDIHGNICKALGVTNMGFSCLYHLVFQRMNSNEKHMFRFHITHGSGNAQTPGGRTQKLKKIMNQTTSIYTLVAHMHDLKVEISPVLDSGNNLELKDRQRIGAITGTFLRTYTQGVEPGYGECKNYDPTSLGCIIADINPSEETVSMKASYA